MAKVKDSVVKVDAELLKQIESFLQKPESKFRYISKKQVVNLAIIKFLKTNDFLSSNSLNKSSKNIKK